jgi:hypothetical protein
MPIMRSLAPRKLDGDCVNGLISLIGIESDVLYEPKIQAIALARACA